MEKYGKNTEAFIVAKILSGAYGKIYGKYAEKYGSFHCCQNMEYSEKCMKNMGKIRSFHCCQNTEDPEKCTGKYGK